MPAAVLLDLGNKQAIAVGSPAVDNLESRVIHIEENKEIVAHSFQLIYCFLCGHARACLEEEQLLTDNFWGKRRGCSINRKLIIARFRVNVLFDDITTFGSTTSWPRFALDCFLLHPGHLALKFVGDEVYGSVEVFLGVFNANYAVTKGVDCDLDFLSSCVMSFRPFTVAACRQFYINFLN